MSESKAPTTATSKTSAPQGKTLELRLTPVANSDHPIAANTSTVQLAPGMAYIDFGFIEPSVLASLPRIAQQGGEMPKGINGRLAARMVMGFDALAQLHQQLTQAMDGLKKAANANNANNANVNAQQPGKDQDKLFLA